MRIINNVVYYDSGDFIDTKTQSKFFSEMVSSNTDTSELSSDISKDLEEMSDDELKTYLHKV